MSIITQALKKAQREQSVHRAGPMPHQSAAALPPQPATPRRWWWVLLPLAGVIALGAGFLFQTSKAPEVAAPLAMTARVPQTAPPVLILQPPAVIPTVHNLTGTSQPQSDSGLSPANPLMSTESTHVPLTRRSPRSMQQAAVEQSSPVTTMTPVRTISVAQPTVNQRLKSEPQRQLARPTKPSSAQPTAATTTQAQARFHEALAAQKAGDLTQAESLFLQTIALDPSVKEAYNSLGNIYYQREKYQLAKSMYHHALEIDANYVKAHNNLGSTYMRLTLHTDAIVHLRQAISLDRDSGLAYYNLACVYARTGDETQAAQYLSQAIERDPAARIWARTDTDFAPVRTTPALQQLLGAS